LLKKLDDSLQLSKDKKYAILVNGMGATPLMEQYIFTHDVLNKLAEKSIEPTFVKVGNYMTSLDMAGISLTIFELADEKWLDYLNYPVETIAW
jgi:dihydroxyacetone kinase-like protein